jgi:hypothetical protein
VANVDVECNRIRDVAQAHGVGLVFLGASEKIWTYACGALWYGQLDTLFPVYERRTWRMDDESTST